MSIDDIDAEQKTVSMLYTRLDVMREKALLRLGEAMRAPTGGTHQSRSERDSVTSMYADQIRQWDAAEHGLCFGRLDYDGGDQLHIGRIGLFDEENDFEPLLIDWRAPAARSFYLATAASPQGVSRRRHIHTRLRQVIGLDDEVLDLSASQVSTPGLTSEAALLGAMNAARTGRMKDIVETIQAEQDKIIRSDLNGILVVQGGPGTGKTAVALHRAAYLLYTHREALTRRGVLILGPNETFLRYISQVLPGLGETSVLLSTLGDLFPTVKARRAEPPQAAAIKGTLTMSAVLAKALSDRQAVPEELVAIELTDDHEGFGFQRETLLLDPETCHQAREKARRSGKPHNLARPIFVEEIVVALAQRAAEKQGYDPYADDPLGGDDAPGGMLLDDADIAEIRKDLRNDTALASKLDDYWPRLSPQQLLGELFADPERIQSAAGDFLGQSEIDLLRGNPLKDGWTPADVPLLDEAAELLGEDETETALLAARLRREQIAYAEGVLDITAGSVSTDIEVDEESEMLIAADVIDAARLAERQVEQQFLTAAQRASVDRRWSFGHIIVDEAQELSPMAWRLLMRRSPNRSMTVVGDVAQTGDLAGASSWAEVFEPYVASRWREAELTVNYRTPAEIMDVAAKVLAKIAPSATPPRSVRQTGVPPEEICIESDKLAELIETETSNLDGGRLGVIMPGPQDTKVDLESQVAVLTVAQAKGLEFDTVIVADPAAIEASSPRGLSDLYVALTRATQRLVLVTFDNDGKNFLQSID